jgi:hypothetical protein
VTTHRVHPSFLVNLIPIGNGDPCHDQLEFAVAPGSSNLGLVSVLCAVVRSAGPYVIQRSGMHPLQARGSKQFCGLGRLWYDLPDEYLVSQGWRHGLRSSSLELP